MIYTVACFLFQNTRKLPLSSGFHSYLRADDCGRMEVKMNDMNPQRYKNGDDKKNAIFKEGAFLKLAFHLDWKDRKKKYFAVWCRD